MKFLYLALGFIFFLRAAGRLKYLFLSTLLFFLVQDSFAQNLVPNPSFEDTVSCPDNLAQIDKAVGWSSYRITPDYFNSCSSASAFPSVSVPSNQWGTQSAKTGNAYAGLITYSLVTNEREYSRYTIDSIIDYRAKVFCILFC